MSLSPILDAFQDVIDHLSDYSGGDSPLDRKQRDYRRAARQAYLDLALGNEWKAYQTRGRINLNPLQNTGTISFDLTGGSYERMVTLTGYTWPTWAPYGTLLISGVRYKVEAYKTSTVITLTCDSAPTADIASGTTYTLYQNIYQLPPDFRRLCDLHFENGQGCMQPLANLSDWLAFDQQEAVSGRPYCYAIGGSPDNFAQMALHVHPYPEDAESIDYVYWRNPRPLYYTGYETEARAGTVAASAAGTTITGTGTSFTAKMVGSLIRFSRNTTDFPSGEGGDNPFQEQKVIIAVDSATSLTVDSALEYAYSGNKYVITDPVDMDAALIMALYRNAELMLDTLRHPERVAARQRLFQSAYIQACERDQRLQPSYGLYGPNWRMMGGTLVTTAAEDDDDSGSGSATVAALFSQTQIQTVANTTSAGDLHGTGEGSLTLAADSWGLGDARRITAGGTYGTKATTAGSLTIRLSWGSLVQTFTVTTMPDAQSTKQWSLSATLTRHSIGPTGTVSGPGTFRYDVEGEPDSYTATDNIANETLASDSAQAVTLTAQWSAADSANTITCNQLLIEPIGA